MKAVATMPLDAKNAGDAEPGAVDNRLSLNPSEFPVIKDWEDGQSYKLSELGDAKITQISPGEFEVEPGEEADTSSAEEADEAATGTKPKVNKAISKMMDEE